VPREYVPRQEFGWDPTRTALGKMPEHVQGLSIVDGEGPFHVASLRGRGDKLDRIGGSTSTREPLPVRDSARNPAEIDFQGEPRNTVTMRRQDDLQALDALLSTWPSAMPAWQVQALFLGALASTNMRLGFHHLLGRVLREDDPAFESIEQANELLAALGAAWNGLVRASESETGARFAPAPLPDPPSAAELGDFAARRHAELVWFVRGIDAGGDDPAEFGALGQELFGKLAEAMAFFERYRELLERKPEDDPKALADGARALMSLSATAEDIVNDILDISKAVRAEALKAFDDLSRTRVRAGVQKIGRNEPCPCGSGRKWKRCCGGASAIEH